MERDGREARTVRDARLQLHELEAAVERVHMAPATALAATAGWYLRKARLALRQAERAFADADDPRLPPLARLRAQIRDRRPLLRQRRKRYRCARCFQEALLDDELLAYYEGVHERCGGGAWEPVARLRKADSQ